MELDCPIEGCGYRGEAASIEGHVSSRTDEGHSGLTGLDVRADLDEQAEWGDAEAAGSTAAAGAGAAVAGLPVLLDGEDGPSTAVLVAGVLLVVVMAYLLLGGGAEEPARADRDSERPEVTG
jgi:hypothetical protein